jgi:hypothetical protein
MTPPIQLILGDLEHLLAEIWTIFLQTNGINIFCQICYIFSPNYLCVYYFFKNFYKIVTLIPGAQDGGVCQGEPVPDGAGHRTQRGQHHRVSRHPQVRATPQQTFASLPLLTWLLDYPFGFIQKRFH